MGRPETLLLRIYVILRMTGIQYVLLIPADAGTYQTLIIPAEAWIYQDSHHSGGSLDPLRLSSFRRKPESRNLPNLLDPGFRRDDSGCRF